MLKACIVVGKDYEENKIFATENPFYNRDNCLYGFHKLREFLLLRGVELNTHDVFFPENCDLIILNERPCEAIENKLRKSGLLKKSVLFVYECPMIRPDNWDKKFHEELAGVFTWDSEVLSDEYKSRRPNYKRGGFVHKIPQQINLQADRKLCTLISGNKKANGKFELYSLRKKIISWFEKNHPSEFCYYGMGWDRVYLDGGFVTKLIKKLGLLKFFPKIHTRCYGGVIANKHETLKNFDFCICFENAYGYPGYITEKIFDCFFAGTVPVYFGDPDIKNYIPNDCFIDYRDFQSFEQLYQFIGKMGKNEIIKYRENIQSFLRSSSSAIFNADLACERIASNIVEMVGITSG